MPATAGRVRMPANNRLSTSDSLRTSEIWQKSVKYDPYAPTESAKSSAPELNVVGEEEKEKRLLDLARMSGGYNDTIPGACKKCGQLGHLYFQCRNKIGEKVYTELLPEIPEDEGLRWSVKIEERRKKEKRLKKEAKKMQKKEAKKLQKRSKEQ